METTEPSVTRTKPRVGRIKSACSACRTFTVKNDQGMGRAALAAWESKHGANCSSLHNASTREGES